MLKGSINKYPIVAKFLLLLGLFLIGEYVFTMISIGLIDLFFPDVDFYYFLLHLKEIKSADEFTADQISSMKLYQFVTSLGRFILVPLFFLYLNGQEFFSGLHLNKPIRATTILMIVLIMFTIPGVINLVMEWNQHINLPESLNGIESSMRSAEDMAQVQTDAFLATTSVSGLLINLLIVGLVAAIGEEILFRGLLQNLIWRSVKNIHVAIWVSAFLFSFIHFQFFGFFPRLILGALLGYLYYWSGSLWSSITAHFVNNAASVISYFLLNRGVIEDNIAESPSWIAAIISFPLVILLLILFKRSQKSRLQLYGERLDDDILNT